MTGLFIEVFSYARKNKFEAFCGFCLIFLCVVSFLMLVSVAAYACPETLRFGDPCNPLVVDSSMVGLSIYDDYNDGGCTKPLLYDGVCPDYLQRGCASVGDCDLVADSKPEHKSYFSDGLK